LNDECRPATLPGYEHDLNTLRVFFLNTNEVKSGGLKSGSLGGHNPFELAAHGTQTPNKKSNGC
jgi:hypothetical protein